MPAERYFIATDLKKDAQIDLEGLEFHHFSNVMRGKVGDEIEIVNGKGALAEATVQNIAKKKAILEITKVTCSDQIPNQVILAQALPRLNRLDAIVEKGTELGINGLWLFPGERSERKDLSESQLERAESITIAAMKQSGRVFLPTITIQPALTKWQKPSLPIYFGDLSPAAPLFLDILKPDQRQIIFCVGPESGFSGKEVESLKALGAIGVKLHQNILRTDTASIAALALITHRL